MAMELGRQFKRFLKRGHKLKKKLFKFASHTNVDKMIMIIWRNLVLVFYLY